MDDILTEPTTVFCLPRGFSQSVYGFYTVLDHVGWKKNIELGDWEVFFPTAGHRVVIFSS
jgi:hypothetical protein